MPARGRGIRNGLVAGLLIGGLLWVVAMAPATTKQGVDYHVTTSRVPVSIKLMEFLVRDHAYRRAASALTQGLQEDEARALAAFQWTREHIRKTPPGWPVVDDHILHIMIRGYGEGDQMADVFTTLSAYAGVPAFWQSVRSSDPDQGLIVLSFVQVEGEWTVWDVERGVIFRDEQGRLAGLRALVDDPGLMIHSGALDPALARFYQPFLETGLRSVTIPLAPRPYAQMPWPRLLFELKRLVGVSS